MSERPSNIPGRPPGLSVGTVRAIRARARFKSYSQLGSMFGLDSRYVGQIVRRRVYKWVRG